MRHRLFFHLAWTTRSRAPLIDARLATFLERFILAVCRQESATVLAIGIVSTDVHLLVRLHPRASISHLVQRLKGGSSCIAEREGHARRTAPLRWAKGYTIESVGWRAVDKVRTYLRHQAIHHPDEAISGWQPQWRLYELAAEAAARHAIPEGRTAPSELPVP